MWLRAVIAVAVGSTATVAAVAQDRPNPAAFLLPPVAADNQAPPPRGGDLPPASEPTPLTPIAPTSQRAATIAPPSDVVPVSATAIQDSRTTAAAPPPLPSQPASNPAKTPDLIDYLTTGKDAYGRERSKSQKTGQTSSFGDDLVDVVNPDHNREPFKSDHCFDNLVSPLTNPFYFEDPRSLTEVRTQFMYQGIPSGEPIFQGGNAWYWGVQGRVAFTDRLSFVFNKLGVIGVDPGNPFVSSQNGLAELWFGPKYTFYRNVDTGGVAAAGLTFQVPAGSSKVLQNTGNLSLVPYVSWAQSFWDTKAGQFNGILSTGYAFSVNNERNSNYHLSAHVDLDVAHMHRFYPLLELNWFLDTTNGSSTPFNLSGRDLVNFGGQSKGANLLTGAIGGRVKITKHVDFGAAFEIPFSGNRDLFDYRWTLDLTWRY